VKKKLWGGEFWSDGYFMSTVGQHGNEESIKKYIEGQGSQYTSCTANNSVFSDTPQLAAG